nr:MAG TPA_asm: PROTEIN (MANNOSE-BINDING PROTEIN A), HOST DEFENSE, METALLOPROTEIN, SUGAR.9A [Caudoviricetes sp.]
MTIKEVLDYVDRIKKNDFTAAEKMRWINEIEGYVQVQIMLLAQPDCISYYPVSESDMSGISFPASNQMLLPRKLKAHVGGLISIEGLVSYPNNNRPNLEILSISEGGKLIGFAEGTFADTGTTPESAIAQLTFDGQETELLVPAPFERLYYEYVLCKISENLEESSAQNNRIATFEETWENFAEWYANNYNPADGNAEFKGYYITGKQGPPGPTGPRGENIYTVTVTENSGVITADKAYAEIYAKVEAGKSVTLVVGGAVYAVNATKQDNLLVLSTAVKSGDKPEIMGYTVSSNNVWTTIKDELALKSVLSSYRTAAAQDAIDATMQKKLTAGENVAISEEGTIPATGGDGGLGVFEVTLTSADGVLTADKTFEQVKAAVADGKPVLKVHSDGDVLWFFLLDKSPVEIDFVGFVDEQILAYLTAKQDGSWETIVTARVTAEMFSALSEKLGNLNNLTTTEKTSLVAAINELKSAAASFAPVATSGSYNDLTDKPTIPSVPTATIQANAAARHEHSNKTALDLISETVKAAWDAASTWVTTNGTNVLSHLSDSIKHITAAERTAWNAKQDKLIAGDNITIGDDGKTISATGGGGGVSGEIETVEAQQIEIPSKLSDFENDSGFVTNSAVEAALADKQDTISDLENIRSGAGKGATALQAVPSTYRTASAQDVIDNGLSDRVSAIEGKEAGWNGKYLKPTGGIPKADLAAAVQTSLGKADTALQSVPSTYRTASAQDTIDSGKVDKVTGKGLSTNDYTAAAKAKVDAIPASPKYTDTVYDDTAVKSRLSAVESKLNGNGSASFASVETAALKATGEVEIFGAQPHVDFHHANSTADYTSRIIETTNGVLDIMAPNGLCVNGKCADNQLVTLTANASRITNVSYTAKYNELLGAVFVRIYGKIIADLNAGYDYDLFSIDSKVPASNTALSVKCAKNAMGLAKTSSVGSAIQICPLESGIKNYDVYITGFWFV